MPCLLRSFAILQIVATDELEEWIFRLDLNFFGVGWQEKARSEAEKQAQHRDANMQAAPSRSHTHCDALL